MGDLNWLVVYTNPRAEKKVAERIEALGITVFCPTYTELRQWSDRKKKVELPLIPSVIFVQLNPKEEVKLYNVPGFVRFLKPKGKLAIVTEQEIENLKIVCQEWNGELVETIAPEEFPPGTAVSVVRGPFKGLVGESITVKGKHRLKIKIEALYTEHLITLPKSHVKILK